MECCYFPFKAPNSNGPLDFWTFAVFKLQAKKTKRPTSTSTPTREKAEQLLAGQTWDVGMEATNGGLRCASWSRKAWSHEADRPSDHGGSSGTLFRQSEQRTQKQMYKIPKQLPKVWSMSCVSLNLELHSLCVIRTWDSKQLKAWIHWEIDS